MESVSFGHEPWTEGEPLKVCGEYVQCASFYKHAPYSATTLRKWLGNCVKLPQFGRLTFVCIDDLCAMISERNVFEGEHQQTALDDLRALRPSPARSSGGVCGWVYAFFFGKKVKNG